MLDRETPTKIREGITKGIRYTVAKGISKASSPETYVQLAQQYYRLRWMYTTDLRNYSVPIDPVKIFCMDPCTIERFTNRPGKFWFDKPSQIGDVSSGEWDLNGKHVTDGWIHQSLAKRFQNQSEWEDTEMYRRYCEDYSQDRAGKLCSYYDQLYERINQDGYRTQIELVTAGKIPIRSLPYLLTNEVTVDIGRNGEPLLVDSKHRLSIARLLNLEEIPVFVLTRHESWMKYLEDRGDNQDNTSLGVT